MKNNREYLELKKNLNKIFHPKNQLNQLFTADCEILKFQNKYLCLSTDGLGEEIDCGLYRSAELWGWMTVITSASDLACTGARPLGLLLNNQWKYGTKSSTKKKFFKGLRQALGSTQIPFLGGDSGSGLSHCHSSTILGEYDNHQTINKDRGLSKNETKYINHRAIKHRRKTPLTRIGVKDKDYLVIHSKKNLGLGPVLAYQFLFPNSRDQIPESLYRPCPDLVLAQKISQYATASIDSSDGIAVSLAILAELNSINWELSWNKKAVSGRALSFCKKNKVHPLMLWMGDLGDYQNLFTIPEKNLKTVLKLSPNIHVLGQAYRCSSRSVENCFVMYENLKIKLSLNEVSLRPRTLSAIRSHTKKMNQEFMQALGSSFKD